ncbi:MAG: PAS domain S-box protein [Opitutales bacterium]
MHSPLFMDAILEELGLTDYFARCPDILLAVEMDGTVLAANEAAAEILERERACFPGLDVFQLIAPADRPAARRTWRELDRQAENDTSLHAHLVRTDGSNVPVEWFAWSAGGREPAIRVMRFRDLSGEQRATEEIRLRNVAIDSLTSGVTIADAQLPDIPLIYVNKGFEQITGYKAREAVGRSCRFLQNDDRRQPALDILRAALRAGEACTVRLRNYRKNGEPFWNELHLSPVYDRAGVLTHFVGVQIDVTDRVESRLRLEESEERYRTLAENTEDIICRLSPGGIIQYASPSITRHLGWEPQAWHHQPFEQLVYPEDRDGYRRETTALAPGRESCKHRFRLRTAGGESIWVEAASTLVATEGLEANIVSVVRDITLQRKAEEEIRIALARERELNLIKSRFIRMVSHEFRTPLTGISASTAFLRDYSTDLPPAKRARHFDNIARSIKRMNQLLDDVLFVSRDESGRLPFNPEPVDVPAYCESLIDEMLAAYPGRRIELDCRLGEARTLALDPNLLHHILQNLLTNALKYSPEDQPVEFSVEREEPSGTLLWAVMDHGIGIPEAEQAQLFQPFERLSNVGNQRGTGLGLHIASRSAQLHGGTITFSSTPGGGSRFVLHIPLPV